MIIEARLALERTLLGSLLTWGQLGDLQPDNFIAPAHQAIYEAMCNVGTDPQLVIAHMREQHTIHLLRSVKGHLYMAELIALADAADQIPALIEQVRRCPRCGK